MFRGQKYKDILQLLNPDGKVAPFQWQTPKSTDTCPEEISEVVARIWDEVSTPENGRQSTAITDLGIERENGGIELGPPSNTENSLSGSWPSTSSDAQENIPLAANDYTMHDTAGWRYAQYQCPLSTNMTYQADYTYQTAHFNNIYSQYPSRYDQTTSAPGVNYLAPSTSDISTHRYQSYPPR